MRIIAGLDEAGRGPLAGPVVAAAVILEDEKILRKLKDSKILTQQARERFYTLITNNSIWAIGETSVEEIDQYNIFQASLLAMQRAFEQLTKKPDEAWIDGIHPPKISCRVYCYESGDAHIPVISAAGILAKVVRDQKMIEYAKLYPAFGFEKHKGYATKAHRAAIQQFGCSPIHRKSFKPVKLILESQN